ncbi:MAG TPA: hypothetical protein VKX28_12345 [Xanthobacteraceae bacterium]|nr:hypothetical protein [Xanthobacteraceae bacterium]
MSPKLPKSLPIATTFIAFSVLGAQSALAANMPRDIAQAQRECKQSKPDCADLEGSKLSACELKVGQIIHACNKWQRWENEENGGPGPQFNRAGRNRDDAAAKGETD